MKKYCLKIIVCAFILLCNFVSAQNSFSPKQSASKLIGTVVQTSGIDAAIQKFDEIKTDTIQYYFKENEFNNLGYKFLGSKSFKEALAVFKMAVELFPKSSNVYDSYAEGYLLSGDKENARKYYHLVLEKDPENRNSKYMIENLDSIFSRHQEEKKSIFSPGQQTGIKGAYFGQKAPGKKPELFARGIISRAFSSDYACTFSPDGKEFYFTRASTMQEIMVSRLEKEGWTYPEPVNFSKGFNAHEPHVTFDNKRIFWGWFRPSPEGEKTTGENYGIYSSENTKSGWSEAKYVGQGMFVSSSRDGKIYVTAFSGDSAFLAQAKIVNNRFTKLIPLAGMDNVKKISNNIAHPCIAPDGSYIIFDIEGGEHLFVSFRKKNNTWSDAIDLVKNGFDVEAGIPSISPDGKYLFFGHKRDIYWVSTKLINDLKLKDL